MSYILGYDSRILVEAISQELQLKGENGHDYLKKIINIQFDLPPIAYSALSEFLPKLLSTTFTRAVLENEVKIYRAYCNACLGELLRNPRTIKSVINHYRVSIAGVENDVCWPDMLALSTLYVTAPEAYRVIANNRDRFFGQKYALLETLKRETERFHETWFATIDSTKREHIKQIIKIMFPRTGMLDRTTAINEQRISTVECFDAYFQHHIVENRLSGEEWTAFLSTIDDVEITKTKITKFSERTSSDGETKVNYIGDLLDRAWAFVGDKKFPKSNETVLSVLKALLANEEIIIATKREQDSLFFWPRDNVDRLLSLFYEALRHIAVAGKNKLDVISKFIKDAADWDEGLLTISNFLCNENREIEKGNVRKISEVDCVVSQIDPPIPIEPIKHSVSIFRERLKQMADDGRLEKRLDLDELVRIWISLDDKDEAKNWLAEQVSDNLEWFLKIIERACRTRMIAPEHSTFFEYRQSNIAFYFDEHIAKSLSIRILKEHSFELNEEQEKLLKEISEQILCDKHNVLEKIG